MADANTTRARKPAELAVGKPLTVRVDQGLYDDLTVMMRTGCDASAALRYACNLTASTFEQAWERGWCPPGIAPDIVSVTMDPYRPDQQSDQAV